MAKMSRRDNFLVRTVLLLMAAIALCVSLFMASAHAQSDSTRIAVNGERLSIAEHTIAEHQDKIESLQIAMAVVKELSEQNNKILWGLMAGTAMMLIERAFGLLRNRSRQEDDNVE